MYNHQDSWLPTEASQLDALYAKQLAQWQSILFAHKEGVFEVTIRSQSITETVVLDGGQIAWELAEALSAKLSGTESSLRRHTEDRFETLGEEARARQGRMFANSEAAREERERIADNEQEFARKYAEQQAALAQQAAATAAPTQVAPAKAGRPRKAVLQEVAAAAAQVPMNGSTANAAARATGSTPQG